ncbi:MAG: Fur family transcriptional regulator [Patescibacteria group bacterium]|jgi:Fur family ferric uptake transcriptional regulator
MPMEKTLLHEKGFRATPAKIALLDVLQRAKKPLSIEAIQELLPSSINQATVYRTLHDFHARGIVRHVDLHHGHQHYEIADAKEHHHIMCKKCGKVKDVATCVMQQLQKNVLKQSGFAEINEHTMEFYGVCAVCDKKR